jgi:putative intracellular protease/amidase
VTAGLPARGDDFPCGEQDSFDRDHPRGSDYVIVPAVHHSDDPRLGAWLQQQAALGATVVGICDGVWVLAGAGLLDGHTATGHWYSLPSLRRTFPRVHWVDDRRYVLDGPVMTTTGVTAALPASVALVARLGGDDAAGRAAAALGASADASHDGGAFHLTPAARVDRGCERAGVLEVGRGRRARTRRRRRGRAGAHGRSARPHLPHDGRHGRGRAAAGADAPWPDDPGGRHHRLAGRRSRADSGCRATRGGLERTLGAIDQAYGAATGDLVRLQLEYPGSR